MRYLQELEEQSEAVVEKVVDLTTYVVRVPASRKILRVRLDGVRKSAGNPFLPEIKEICANAQTFTYRTFYQRTVFLDLTDFDEAENCFIGEVSLSLHGRHRTLQELLLSEGLVYMEGSFNAAW